MRVRLLHLIALLLPAVVVAQFNNEWITLGLTELSGGTSVPKTACFTDASDLLGVVAGTSADDMGVEKAGTWSITGIPNPPNDFGVAPSLDAMKDSRGNSVDTGGGYRWLVGWSIDNTDNRKPAIWYGCDTCGVAVLSAAEVLPTMAGGEGSAIDVMWTLDRLGVVGSSNNGTVDKPVYWDVAVGPSAAYGTPPLTSTLVPLPDDGPASIGEAEGVAPLSLVDLSLWACTGWSTDAQGDTIPRFWKTLDAGSTWTMTPLPLLPGGNWGTADDIIARDSLVVHAVGSAETAGGMRRGVVWRSEDGGTSWTVNALPPAAGLPNSASFTGTTAGDLGLFPIQNDDADGLPGSRKGTDNIAATPGGGGAALAALYEPPLYIAGRSYGPGNEVASLWRVWSPGDTSPVHDLNTLVSGSSPYVLRKATGIALRDDGTLVIAGVGTDIPARRSASANGGTGALSVTPVGPHGWVAYSTVTTFADPRPARTPAAIVVSASPNPFSSMTSIFFRTPASSEHRVTVYDVAGRRVAGIEAITPRDDGFVATWNGRDDRGRKVPSGVYMVKVASRGRVGTAKVVLVR